MTHLNSTWQRTLIGVLGCCSALLGTAAVASAGNVSTNMTRSFAFPLSFANGVAGDLVMPAGSATKLSFDAGMVAIGELPVPLPQRTSRHGRAGDTGPFFRPRDEGPHVRLLLNNVVDEAGPVTNTGNQLIIDAVVTPPGGASNGGPPFIVPFDIKDGTVFVDALLPVQSMADGSVRVQIVGVSVVDPGGQPFGVLGFQLPPSPSTPLAHTTPTPGGPPQLLGQCFVGRTDCAGPSYAASQKQCCSRAAHGGPENGGGAWCPPEQFDAATGRCLTGACNACAPPPAKTPTPGPCGDTQDCSGTCSLSCPDGTTVAGECVVDSQQLCRCDAVCRAPTPCDVGQCFDTLSFRCTGQACSPGSHCALPNQLCDVSGRFCPCEPPPPPPYGRICCQCKAPSLACFDFQLVEVQPLCPPGCDTFMGQDCDGRSGRCVPLPPCSSDKECDDSNGCTVDRCTPDGCTHDCVCVGPHACGSGPTRGVSR